MLEPKREGQRVSDVHARFELNLAHGAIDAVPMAQPARGERQSPPGRGRTENSPLADRGAFSICGVLASSILRVQSADLRKGLRTHWISACLDGLILRAFEPSSEPFLPRVHHRRKRLAISRDGFHIWLPCNESLNRGVIASAISQEPNADEGHCLLWKYTFMSLARASARRGQ